MERDFILREIHRTAEANGGVPLGWRRFEEESGIRYHDWYGRFWARWGDAVREAGYQPNHMVEAYDEDFLLEKLALLSRRLGRIPTHGDVLLASRTDPDFPSDKTFRRLGDKRQRASRVKEFCARCSGYEDVAEIWSSLAAPSIDTESGGVSDVPTRVGYVYLVKHGSRREFKIGRTNNPLRREGEISVTLPEQLEPIHYIKTDDPVGVEAYWHTRFASKRKGGEWFALTSADVSAFKRWRSIF
jgi:hypothetical protein